MKRSIATIIILVSSVLLSACQPTTPPLPTQAVLPSANNNSTAVSPTAQPAAATQAAVSDAPTVASAAGPDACAIVTPAVLKTTLGLDVDKSVPSPSAMGGTSCKLSKGTDTIVLIQLSDNAKLYYQPQMYTGITNYDEGTYKGFYLGPDSGNASAAVVKGNAYAFVTTYSKTAYTLDQVKALLKVIADAL